MTEQPTYKVRKSNAKKVKSAWSKLETAHVLASNAKKQLVAYPDSSERIKDNTKQRRNLDKTFEKFMKIVMEHGIDPEFFDMSSVQRITVYVNDNKHMVGYNYEDGDNSTRHNGFKENPYHTLKGKFYQNTIKPMIRKAIYGAHAYWLAKYSKDAFVYDDARLKAVDEFTKRFIDDHMAHAEYKLEFMHILRDLVCGMVKEDPFYTSAFWAFINEFVHEFPDGFEMAEAEIYNWEAHHHGKTDTND